MKLGDVRKHTGNPGSPNIVIIDKRERVGLGMQPGHPVPCRVLRIIGNAEPLAQGMDPWVTAWAAAVGLAVQCGQSSSKNGPDLSGGQEADSEDKYSTAIHILGQRSPTGGPWTTAVCEV